MFKFNQDLNPHHQLLLEEIKARSGKPTQHTYLDNYLGNAHPRYAINAPTLREIGREWKNENRNLGANEFQQVVSDLIEGESATEKVMAGILLDNATSDQKKFKPEIFDRWLDHLVGWAEIDSVCTGKYTVTEIPINIPAWKKLLTHFSKGDNINKRRASLVFLCSPLRLNDNPDLATLALEVVNRLKSEKEVIITRAISWVLRCMVKHHRKVLVAYLKDNEETLPSIAVRETKVKLKTGTKSGKTKSKIKLKKIALVTCSTKPDFAPDDLLVVHALQKRGADVQAMPWDSGLSNWASFDRVILRSCWNYHQHPTEFRQWLNELEMLGVNLSNPAHIVKWNTHKSYLRELEHDGIPIPETVWVPKKSEVQLDDVLKTRRWAKAVVKPAISATAFNTFLVSAEEADAKQIAFNELNETSDLLLQKFMPEIQREGEWSLLFFNRQFSHAVIKKAKASDFRVQNDFGGTFQVATPPDFILQQAAKILAVVKEPLLYTRIDGIVSNKQFVLMELELIEPVLFLDQKPGAAERLAELILV